MFRDKMRAWEKNTRAISIAEETGDTSTVRFEGESGYFDVRYIPNRDVVSIEDATGSYTVVKSQRARYPHEMQAIIDQIEAVGMELAGLEPSTPLSEAKVDIPEAEAVIDLTPAVELDSEPALVSA